MSYFPQSLPSCMFNFNQRNYYNTRTSLFEYTISRRMFIITIYWLKNVRLTMRIRRKLTNIERSNECYEYEPVVGYIWHHVYIITMIQNGLLGKLTSKILLRTADPSKILHYSLSFVVSRFLESSYSPSFTAFSMTWSTPHKLSSIGQHTILSTQFSKTETFFFKLFHVLQLYSTVSSTVTQILLHFKEEKFQHFLWDSNPRPTDMLGFFILEK